MERSLRSRSLWEDEGWAILTLSEFEGDREVAVVRRRVEVMAAKEVKKKGGCVSRRCAAGSGVMG